MNLNTVIGCCAAQRSALADPFKLLVDTTKAGSASDTFILPAYGGAGESFNCTVDWGDGNTEDIVGVKASPGTTHVYAASGTYTVSITEKVVGGFPTMRFFSEGDCFKVMELKNWGMNTWVNLEHAFNGCTNMVITATDHATAKTGGVLVWDRAFNGCSAFVSFPLLDTSGAVSMIGTWSACVNLTSFPAINTSNVLNISNAWYGCDLITSFPFIDTSKVTVADSAWRCLYTANLTSFPILDLSKCVNLERAWSNQSSLPSFAVLNNDLSSCTNFISTWLHCHGLTSFTAPDMRAMTDGTACFGSGVSGVVLPTADYSAILNSLAAVNPNNGITFDGGKSKYNAGASAARATLTTTKTWVITDGGLE